MVIAAGEEEYEREATPERPAASAIHPNPPLPPRRPRSRLHYFKFPSCNSGCQRVLHCSNRPLTADPDAAGSVASAVDQGGQTERSKQPSPPPKSLLSPKPSMGFTSMKESEKKGREEAYAERSLSHAAATEAAGAARPWNLRTRRAACKSPAENQQCRFPDSSSGSPLPLAVDKMSRRSSAIGMVKGGSDGSNKGKRQNFSVSLTREEIRQDFLALTGTKSPRRPKKRPRIIQRQLELLYPGQWLSEITPTTYKVEE